MSLEARAKWEAERLRALTDHMYLGVEVMGMDFQEIPHRGLFSHFIQKDPEQDTPLYDLSLVIKKRMVLWPRGTFKTSAIIVEIVQFILNFPNIRTCFLTGGDGLAKRQVARVKRVFEKPTKKFRNLFPEFCGEKLGNAHQFTVPCRTNDTFAEPTMAISTAKTVKAGSHYDIIFVDDLVNETNYRSPKLLQKCIEDYRDICPLLAPDGFMYVTGTRYSFGDLYEEIQTMAKKEMKELGRNQWKFSILPCWVRYCRNCSDGCSRRVLDHDFDQNALAEPTCRLCPCKGWEDTGIKDVLFPRFRCKDGRTEGHTVEWLESERLRLGAEFFANQYENNPIAAGDQTFTPGTFSPANPLPRIPISDRPPGTNLFRRGFELHRRRSPRHFRDLRLPLLAGPDLRDRLPGRKVGCVGALRKSLPWAPETPPGDHLARKISRLGSLQHRA